MNNLGIRIVIDIDDEGLGKVNGQVHTNNALVIASAIAYLQSIMLRLTKAHIKLTNVFSAEDFGDK